MIRHEEKSLIEAIRQDPGSLETRMIHRDWLCDHGQEERSDWISKWLEMANWRCLASFAHNMHRCKKCLRANALMEEARREWLAGIGGVVSWMHGESVFNLGCGSIHLRHGLIERVSVREDSLDVLPVVFHDHPVNCISLDGWGPIRQLDGGRQFFVAAVPQDLAEYPGWKSYSFPGGDAFHYRFDRSQDAFQIMFKALLWFASNAPMAM